MELIASLKQRLFRWKSDGAGPLQLGQRRIFILPSRGGLLYATTLLVMLIGAINYNLALGHALVFMLAGLGVSGMIHTFRNLYGLVIAPGRSPSVFAGELAYFELSLENTRDTPRLALEFTAETGQTVLATVNPKKCSKIEIPITTTRRGWLELPRVRLSSNYPLGLFTAWAYLQPSMRCLVYPKAIASPFPALPNSLRSGEQSGDSGQEDFAGFRPRQPADSPRHVAWKASARDAENAPLLVKLFSGGGHADLIFDWQQTSSVSDNETRIGLLTGWVLAAHAAHLEFGMALPDTTIPSSSGESHLHRCLQALALIPG